MLLVCMSYGQDVCSHFTESERELLKKQDQFASIPDFLGDSNLYRPTLHGIAWDSCHSTSKSHKDRRNPIQAFIPAIGGKHRLSFRYSKKACKNLFAFLSPHFLVNTHNVCPGNN